MITYFDPQPTTAELPARFPSPFATEPHPLALRAARVLERVMPPPVEGKMFGVLVVRAPDGRVGFLRAFSGMLEGTWRREGFVGPTFDEPARDAFWPTAEAGLGELAARQRILDHDPVHAAYAELRARHAAAFDELRARHAARKAARHVARDAARGDAQRLRALDHESRGDSGERRRLERAHATEAASVAPRANELARASAVLARTRSERSRELLIAIHATYLIVDARGVRVPLRDLFAPESPPGGAGDCAAPKLLAHAYRERLSPIALAELWLGPEPPGGGRHAGACYPACRGKCEPILAHMLDGLDAEPPPVFGARVLGPDEPRIVFEDRWLVVVDKPEGMLSVPGRSGSLRDSVATRLATRCGNAHIVHRLDLDVSGLMLVAKDEATHAVLQRQFARREIDKHYIAIVDGEVAGDAGVIELRLRVDLEDRPRQIVDPAHGKAALTEWRVIERTAGRTRVELAPRTGRTHQLRVHAAHGSGLAAPIVGDRLYGRAAARLLLHAERLAFVHPHAGTRIELQSPAPF